ncbi:hypothetical protein H2202_004353 [Exophiala xenobiotica]|nr:hypothetical protein H2202_004353 [Exophiala xenobiotica]KAK5290271.1 hypothetical protein LTR14_006573 [Exophiala xenobiotica]KAK5379331.1 hypothetical protein LTS03_004209 [Exophiala xenobiotica]KAK5381969.1 hypothetical protein LTS13_002631 [Exophiala xenobiotica]KAK5394443.1 hypothetical protein LTR79_007893 [Exophiala xenobiotica]
MLPVLGSQYRSQDYFIYSPCLFWTIVVTGARRYTLDPTILETLAPKVSSLLAISMTRISQYIPTICALLILCAWPLPMESASDDPSPVYAGVVMQLSLQNGLHMLGKGQDFSESPVVRDTNQDLFRTRLWAWCKVICRCSNLFSGLPPHIFPDAFESELNHQDIHCPVDPFTDCIQKVESISSRALTTLMQTKHEEDNVSGKPGPLHAIIRLFDEEILKIKRESQGLLADIWFNSIRLHLNAFHFFDSKSTISLARLTTLYHIACNFVENITTRDRQDDYALYLSEQYYRTLSLAATSILRVHRSPELSPSIDHLLGERSYFAAIQILKKRSIKNNDLNARVATILVQLWQSQTVFRREDGTTDSLTVRIRSRGAMGIVYDCFWYWRREFLGYQDPYSLKKATLPHEDDELPTMAPQQDDTAFQGTGVDTAGYRGDALMNHPQDDAFFSEWNWSADESFFASLPQSMNSMTYM